MTSWDYLDFELEVGEGAGRDYPLRVHSPLGEATAEMRFPFDQWELKDRLKTLEIALLRTSGTRRRIPSPDEQAVLDFGRGLFEALLVGEVRTSLVRSLDEARRQNKGLRLKLRIDPKAPELATLPWEFLYDAEQGRYLSLSSMTPLVRYLDLPRRPDPLLVSPPLRILGMVASPLGLDQLNVEREKRYVEDAVAGLPDDLVELEWLKGQTWRHLQQAMWDGPWHVFHFVGHGGFDPATEEGAVAIADEAGRKHLFRASSLAELLTSHYPLRLVFLNSCDGARGSSRDAFSSAAATLVRSGVPAVVAMQYEITDTAAIEFSRTFYQAVAHGLPVDAAVTEARKGVSMSSMLEWGTPVLYMRSPDGRIFEMPEPVSKVAALYNQGLRHVNAKEWPQALKCFEQVQRLEGGFRETEELLTQVRRELTPLSSVEVPNLSGQTVPQAISSLTAKGLKLGNQHEILHDTILKGQIFEQIPEDGAKVEAGSSVNVTISKGPSTVEVPDLTGQLLTQAREALSNAGLKVGDQNKVPTASMPKGRVIRQNPAGGTKAKRGTSVRVTLSSGPANIIVSEGPRRKYLRILVGGLVVLALLVLFLSFGPSVVLEDNFSDVGSGWTDPQSISGGGYFLSTGDQTAAIDWNEKAGTLKDAIVEVDATDKTDGPTGKNWWGVACRIRDANHYYFTITNQGEAYIMKHGANEVKKTLISKSSEAFDPTATNNIRAECVGSTLTLYVNDEKLLETTNTKLNSGYVGLYAEDGLTSGNTDGPAPVRVLFDNFKVSTP